jgi:hypothetical protein
MICAFKSDIIIFPYEAPHLGRKYYAFGWRFFKVGDWIKMYTFLTRGIDKRGKICKNEANTGGAWMLFCANPFPARKKTCSRQVVKNLYFFNQR